VHRFWQVDLGVFHRTGKPRRVSRVLDRLRQLGSFLLVALALSYPLTLVYLGIAYGGFVFWGSFSGSLVIIYVIISRLGFARNFEGWGSGFLKRLVVLVIAFGAAAGFYLSLFSLRILTIPLIICLLISGLVYFLRK